MFNARLAGDDPVLRLPGMSSMLSFVPLFSHEICWLRSGTELSQFLRIFLPAFPRWRQKITMKG